LKVVRYGHVPDVYTSIGYEVTGRVRRPATMASSCARSFAINDFIKDLKPIAQTGSRRGEAG
jgi:hypothetical protein